MAPSPYGMCLFYLIWKGLHLLGQLAIGTSLRNFFFLSFDLKAPTPSIYFSTQPLMLISLLLQTFYNRYTVDCQAGKQIVEMEILFLNIFFSVLLNLLPSAWVILISKKLNRAIFIWGKGCVYDRKAPNKIPKLSSLH